MKFFLKFLSLLCVIMTSMGDVYLHGPRGSNNRLNEQSATRANNNRMFDSQNNARGGYNVGDSGSSRSSSEDQQYRMAYYQSGLVGNTELTIEWTNQHGCGGNEDNSPHKLNCNLVLQFMCQDNVNQAAPDDSITFRNGRATNTQAFTASNNDNDALGTVTNRRNGNVRNDRGLHESWEWYDNCNRRERNKGLFTADQQLNGNTAVYTRQNPQGTRRGYECPEERDYYPYFHPTPWVDIAVLAHNESSCSYYKNNSFNHRTYGECVENFSQNSRKHWSTVNNPAACSAKGGEWVEYHSYLELAPSYTSKAACEGQNNNNNNKVRYMWGKPYDMKKIVNHQVIVDVCFVLPPPVDCKAAEWSRVNHLGNGRDLTPLNYTWNLPHFPSGDKQRCVFRLRYNISTDDYDPFNTDASHNEQKQNNAVVKRSPIEQNPLVDVGARGQLLQLAINTDQTGRVFQDRSHVFFLEPRPTGTNGISDEGKIINLNVRGKRGNIVQVYPAVEYDFLPNKLNMTEQDYIHIQWTGSNSHNNNNPAGDGQAGDAGEGQAGTDRSNFVQMIGPGENYPSIYEKATLFQNMEVILSKLPSSSFLSTASDAVKQKSASIQLASSGYYKCDKRADCSSESVESKANINNLLNNAPASFPGLVARIKKGVYYYMCTRNNNFSNRSQKGQIVVT